MTPLERAHLSLNGLSLGDAFGERFFGETDRVVKRIQDRTVPSGPWVWTDDTEMACALVETLIEDGLIQQDALAAGFAKRFTPGRGYGQSAYAILTRLRQGASWRAESYGAFRGRGSFGNGAAMRVAPLGAFLAEERLETVIEQARASAEVTHAHAEGIAGAIAVASATALAWRCRDSGLGPEWLREVRDTVPSGLTRDGIEEALRLTSENVVEAANALGNGSSVSAPDTVPLCLWVASRYSHDFREALWTTVAALGDRDTTCAIVGGIVSMTVGTAGLPQDWLLAREPLPPWVEA